MKSKLLFCEYVHGSGSLLRSRMKPYDIDLTVCKYDFDVIEAELENSAFDAMLMNVPCDEDEYTDFIRKTAEKYPNMKIYAVSDRNCTEMMNAICDAGAWRCLIAPVSFTDFCCMLATDLSPCGEKLVSEEIAKFLESKNFATYLAGFRFLCIAVGMVVEKPSILYQTETVIEPYIAEMLHTTPEFVDRAIVELSDNVIQLKNWRFDGYIGNQMLSAMEIIAASADEFMTDYKKAEEA